MDFKEGENANGGHKEGGGMDKRGDSRAKLNKIKKDLEPKEEESVKFQLLHKHHRQTLWIYWSVVFLGFWLLAAPFTFSYAQDPALPSGGREVWLPLPWRIDIMYLNNLICGALLIFFGMRCLIPNRPASRWICCIIGVWLSFAPILFWYPSAVAYYNDTLVGALVMALTAVIPGMPNMVLHMEKGPMMPTGWSYNPSSWAQRSVLIVFAFIGWMISRYMATYQLGYMDFPYDPFFGDSTQRVLDSDMSHALPVSDSGLGAFAYTIEFLMGWMGSEMRWRSMPWMIGFFFILIVPLGIVHIVLVISQPVIVGYWCTFCLLAAATMLPMIPLMVDEAVGTGQFILQAKRQGKNLWDAIWYGVPMEEQKEKQKEHHHEHHHSKAPEMVEFYNNPIKIIKASFWGMSAPINLILSTAIGVFLMFAPGLFGIHIEETAANIHHIGGALIIVVSVIAMAEVVRLARYGNIVLGLGLAVAIWFTSGGDTFSNIVASVAGVLVAGLAIPRGPKKHTYGMWDKYVK